MDKICKNCCHWTQVPEMKFLGEDKLRSTDEWFCGKSRNMNFGAYGQDGKAIITAPSFGCNQWKQSGQ